MGRWFLPPRPQRTVCGAWGAPGQRCHENLRVAACLCQPYVSSVHVGASLLQEDALSCPFLQVCSVSKFSLVFVCLQTLRLHTQPSSPNTAAFSPPGGPSQGGIWTQWCLLSRLARSAHYLPLSEEGRCWMSSIWWVA